MKLNMISIINCTTNKEAKLGLLAFFSFFN